jgi:hypothetical protein
MTKDNTRKRAHTALSNDTPTPPTMGSSQLLPHAPVTPLSCIGTSGIPEKALAVIEWTIFDGVSHTDSIRLFNEAGYGRLKTVDTIRWYLRKYGSSWYSEQGAVRPWKLYTFKEKIEMRSRGRGENDFPFIHPRDLPTRAAPATDKEASSACESSAKKKARHETCPSGQNVSASTEAPSELPDELREGLLEKDSQTQTRRSGRQLLGTNALEKPSEQREDAAEQPLGNGSRIQTRRSVQSLSDTASLEPTSAQLAEANFVSERPDRVTNNKSKPRYTTTKATPAARHDEPGTSISFRNAKTKMVANCQTQRSLLCRHKWIDLFTIFRARTSHYCRYIHHSHYHPDARGVEASDHEEAPRVGYNRVQIWKA